MAASDYVRVVQEFYIAYFGRPADPAGLRFYSEFLDANNAPTTAQGLINVYAVNPTIRNVINSFGESAESLALYAGASTSQRVTSIYLNLLNRQPDLGGLSYWVNEIDSGRLVLARAALSIAAAAEANGGTDGQIVANKIAVGANFNAAIDTVAELNAYVGDAAAAIARDLLSQVTATTNVVAFQANVNAAIANIVNAAPSLLPDVAAATEGGSIVAGSVATNDRDINNTATEIRDVQTYAPAAGQGAVPGLTFNSNGSYSFDPTVAAYNSLRAGATQTITFNYQVTDGKGGLSTSTLTITVTGTNDAPVATALSQSGNEDNAITGNLSTLVTDVDTAGTGGTPETATFAIVTGVANGTLVLNPATGAYTYTPNANFNGADSFTYRVTDAAGATATATVSLSVNSVNDAPVPQNSAISGNENTTIIGVVGATDADGDTLTYSLAPGGQAANGTVAIGANGAYTYTPNAGFNGTDSFTFRVFDGTTSSTGTVTVTVNDVPNIFTAGVDIFNGTVASENFAAFNNNLNANDSVNGGGGIDTVQHSVDSTLPIIPLVPNFAGFVFNDVDVFAVTNDSGRTVNYDLSSSGNIGNLVSDNSSSSVNFNFAKSDATNTTNLTVRGLTAPVNVALDIRDTDNTGADTVNLSVLSAGGPVGTISIDDDVEVVNLSTVNSPAAVVIGTLDTDQPAPADNNGVGANTLNITTGAVVANTLTITNALDNSLLNVNATGAAGVNLTGGNNGVSFILGGANDTIIGGTGNDSMLGGGGADNLNGGAGNDTIRGEAGDDSITAGAGIDSLDGGAGNDRLVFAAGDLLADDSVAGGADTDTLVYNDAAIADATFVNKSSIEVLELGVTSTANLNDSAFAAGISSVTGSGGGDVINVTDDNVNTRTLSVSGLGGNDTVNIIDDGGGDAGVTLNVTTVENVAIGNLANTVVNINDATGTAVLGKTFGGRETVNGGAGADSYTARSNSLTNFFNGNGGNDTLIVNAGQAATVTGVETITVAAAGRADVADNTAANITLTGGASVNAGGGNDTINLSVAGLDSVNGGAGNDTVNAGASLDANDTINGAGGSNVLSITEAGPGTLDVDFTNTSNFQTLQLNETGGAGSTVTLGTEAFEAGIATVIGSSSFGGNSNDTINITASAPRTLTVEGGEEFFGGDTDTVNITGASTVTLNTTNVEVINGGAATGALTVTATGAGDVSLTGGSGSDRLTTSGGNDTITGGVGSDTISAGEGNDRIIMANQEFLTDFDSVDGGGGTDALALVATVDGAGFTATDNDFGSRFTNMEQVAVVGVAGGATEVFNLSLGANASNSNFSEFFVENDAALNATFSNLYTRNATINGGSLDDTINASAATGSFTFNDNAGNDSYTGTAQGDVFNLGTGTDTVIANGGADTILGGANLTDADLVNGGTGGDVLNFVANGTLTAANLVSNIETYNLFDVGSANYNLTLDNDNLGSGTLTINTDVADNGLDNDANDNYVVNTGGVTNFTLAYNGGAGDDTVVGTANGDTISLGGGTNLVQAGGGNDTINLAAFDGQDTIVFESSAVLNGVDNINNFTAGQDVLNFSAFVAGGSGGSFIDGDFLVPQNVNNTVVVYTGTQPLQNIVVPAGQAGLNLPDDGKFVLITATSPGATTFDIYYVFDGIVGAGYAENIVRVDPVTLTAGQTFQDFVDFYVGGFGVVAEPAPALLLGTAGDDLLQPADLAAVQPDTAIGGAGNDTINTGAGDDQVIVSLDGTNPGADQVNTGTGQDTITVNNTTGQAVRVTFTSADVGNNDALDGNNATNEDGGLAVRFQQEGPGDTLTGPVQRYDDEGIAFVGGKFDVRDLPSGIARGTFDRVVLGTDGADSTGIFAGTTLDDYINGGAGNDTFTGGDGNDFLVGGAGNDSLTGDAGNDSFIGGGGNDIITGGTGNDVAIFNITNDGTDNVDLGNDSNDVVNVAAAAPGQVRVTFTSSDVGNGNALDGNNAANEDGGLAVRLQLEDGADGLIGTVSRFDDEGTLFVAGAGVTFDVRNLTEGAPRGDQFGVVVLGTSAADTYDFSAQSANYYINGGAGNDTLTGGSGNDFLVGSGGNDSLSGGLGNDTLFGVATGDVVSGGAGTDFAQLADGNVTVSISDIESVRGGTGNDSVTFTAALIATVNGNGGTDVVTGSAGTDDYTIIDVDSVLSGAGNDTIRLTDVVNLVNINGGADADLVLGGTLADTLTLTGVETVNSGAGLDVLTVTDAATVSIDLGADNDSVTFTGGATTTTIEGGAGTDTVSGSANADFLTVDNVETVNGNAGNDTITLLAPVVGGVTVNGGNDSDTVNGSALADLLATTGVERANLGDGNDTITTDNTAIFVDAGAGNDSVTTGTGADTVVAGTGNENISTGTGNDIIRFAGGELTAADTVAGGGQTTFDAIELTSAGSAVLTNVTGIERLDLTVAGTYTLSPVNAVGLGTILGSTGADTINIDTLITAVTINGNGGTDTVNLLGNIDYSVSTIGIATITSADGEDTINASANGAGIVVRSGTDDDSITGSAFADVFEFADAALDNNDTVNGGALNDTVRLTGAATGNFTADLGNVTSVEILELAGTAGGTVNYIIDIDASNAGSLTTVTGSAATEFLDFNTASAISVTTTSVETVEGGAAADTLTSTTAASLFGSSGTDTLTLQAGGTVQGGDDNDTLNLDTVAGGSFVDRVVFEATAAGNDTDTINFFDAAAGGDVLDFSAIAGTFALSGGVATANPAATSINGLIIRLSDIPGGQDITTAAGLETALQTGEYNNYDLAAGQSAIVLTASSLSSNVVGAYYVTFVAANDYTVAQYATINLIAGQNISDFVAGNFIG